MITVLLTVATFAAIAFWFRSGIPHSRRDSLSEGSITYTYDIGDNLDWPAGARD